jgi:hypothetical protein
MVLALAASVLLAGPPALAAGDCFATSDSTPPLDYAERCREQMAVFLAVTFGIVLYGV